MNNVPLMKKVGTTLSLTILRKVFVSELNKPKHF